MRLPARTIFALQPPKHGQLVEVQGVDPESRIFWIQESDGVAEVWTKTSTGGANYVGQAPTYKQAAAMAQMAARGMR